MKAIVIEEFGSNDVLKRQEVDVPTIGADDVLIENHAFSINPLDWKRREGAFKEKLPLILGEDLAGVVKEVGQNITHVKPGDFVYANAKKAYAEFVKVPGKFVVKMPPNINFTQAASIPLAGQTAYEALVDAGRVEEGQKVLIHGGAGGVGTLAIQIAKAFNTEVITTASPENHEFLGNLGADQVIDYNTENFWEVISGVDLVIDSIGGETLDKSFEILNAGGRLVSLLEEPEKDKAQKYNVTALYLKRKSNGEALEKLTTLLNDNYIQPVVTQTFSFSEEDVQKTHEISETGHVRGKIVVEIQ